MRFKECKIDGVDVLQGGTKGIFFSKTQRRRLQVDDSSEFLGGSHGRIVSPTYARTRSIILEGYVDNSGNENEQEALEHLEQTFALQSNTGSIVPKVLYIKDLHDKERKMNVKVSEPLVVEEYDDDMRDYARKWRAELESIEDPRYYSYQEVAANVQEADYGGFTMGFEMGFSMDLYTNFITLETTGNATAPMRREITVLDDFVGPLTIRDITNGKDLVFDIDGVTGDEIVIDTGKYTATKNGVSFKSDRIEGSQWLTIDGTASFVVFSKDGGLEYNDFDIDVYFRHVLL